MKDGTGSHAQTAKVVGHFSKARNASLVFLLIQISSCSPDISNTNDKSIISANNMVRSEEVEVHRVPKEGLHVDGQVHIFMSGTFVITNETQFCIENLYNDDFPKHTNLGRIYLYDMIKLSGQGVALNGVGRIAFAPCNLSGDVIQIKRDISNNISGKPYRLDWSAKQGDATINLILQRDGDDPNKWPVKINQFVQIDDAITFDCSKMSKLLADKIFQGKIK